ncbi:hypothetical protein SNE40_016101 [Patella caerulea]|uniref:N-acetylgalactosaminide beta-1,3-galactosyltransferase n=2 Tax=Patella caerulea TaxID=87958 RepID=A0AAN8J883_PATCE
MISRKYKVKIILFVLSVACILSITWNYPKNSGKLIFLRYPERRDINDIKVACFILATPNAKAKMEGVNETWVQDCDKYFFVMTSKNSSHDVLNVSIPEGRTYLTDKVVYAFQYLHDHYLNEYDWFVKADDDTYMIVENLKFLVSHYKGQEPAYIGSHLKMFAPNGYMAGGCGYALNREALKKLIKGYQKPGLCRLTGGAEDLETGRCLAKMGVPIISSVDKYDKETFQAGELDEYRKGNLPGWIQQYVRNRKQMGQISQYTISYHQLSPDFMRRLHFVIHNMKVFQPEIDTKNYFSMNQVPPIKDIRRERPFLSYFFETRQSYVDIEAWRQKNNTVLTHDSPKRT